MASALADGAMPSLARAPSLGERAADAIAEGVASGALQPGQRLVETELAAMLDMSRVPLREAFRILEVQGIVETVPHRGTRVAAFDEAQTDRTLEVRVALERIAARDAGALYRADPSRLVPLDRILGEMEDAARRRDWMAISRADLAFHGEIIRVSGNRIVATLWETLARHVLILLGQEIRDERDADIYPPQHWRMRHVLASGDGEAIHREVEAHVLRLRSGRVGEPA